MFNKQRYVRRQKQRKYVYLKNICDDLFVNTFFKIIYTNIYRNSDKVMADALALESSF